MAAQDGKVSVLNKLERFAESTSLRGVPRILRSKSRCLRWMWFLAVVFGASFAVFSLTTVFRNFFSYSTTVKLEERDANPEFPDVTLCNLNPLSSAQQGFIHFHEYVQAIEKVKDQLLADVRAANASKIQEYDVFAHLSSAAAYFQNFPIPKLLKENFTSNIVWSCNLYKWDWTVDDNVDCLNDAMEPYWTPFYNLCTRISLSGVAHIIKNSVRAMSLVIFLNNNNDLLALDYKHNMLHSKASGLRLVVHSPNTLPDLKKGINISPGHETSVTIQLKEKHLEPAPYSSCQRISHLKVNNDTQEKVRYDQSTCMEICLQDRLLNKCKCLNPDLAFHGHYLHSHTFCANASLAKFAKDLFFDQFQHVCAKELKSLWQNGNGDLDSDSLDLDSDSFEDFIRIYNGTDLRCFQNFSKKSLLAKVLDHDKLGKKLGQALDKLLCVSKSDLGNESCDCPQPCDSVEYEKTSISQAPWPHWSYRYAFFCNIIAPRLSSFPRLLKWYQNLFGNCSQPMHSYDDILNQSLGLEPIHDEELLGNFLQLNILFESRQKVVYTSQRAYTWDTLLSVVGATLNLWMGLTFITVVELFELLYEIFYVSSKKKENEGALANSSVQQGSVMPITGTSKPH